MSCCCGESKCSCSESCFCFSEFCLCAVCFRLKQTVSVKSEERNMELETNASTVPIKSETMNARNKSNSDEDNAEIVYSSYDNLGSDLFSIDSDKMKLEVKKESPSKVIYSEITLSDSEHETTVLKQQDSSKIRECSIKKGNSLLKLKSDSKTVDLKLNQYKRYFEYFSSKATSSKRKKRSRSWNYSRFQKSGFKMRSRKSKYSQSRKRLASMSQPDNEVKWENESNKREIKEEEYSGFNTCFNDVSSGYSDYDTDEKKSSKTSTSNRQFSLNIGGSFSEPEGTGCDLSETEPCSRCKRKKGMQSYYKSLQNNETFARISNFQEGPLISFGQQTDPMPSNNTEIRIKKEATESSTLQGNSPDDTRNLSVYDFDEKESEISSSHETLTFRKRSVKMDNSGKLEINVYPTVGQSPYSREGSQIDSLQNADSSRMDSQATSNKKYVSPLNASSSAETLNDCMAIHQSDRKTCKKRSLKALQYMRRKFRKTAKSKREEGYIKRNLEKETKIKTEVKKEKVFSEKGTSFIKKEIKKEIP